MILVGNASENLILQGLIIANSASVGSIKGYNMVFKSIVQYVNNASGITYEGISTLLLSNTGWFNTNGGTYETYKGTFGFIEKQGGFMNIDAGKIGMDLSTNPTLSSGVLSSVSFSGSSSNYIKRLHGGV